MLKEMGSYLKLGRVLGVEIRLDYSWFFISILISLSFFRLFQGAYGDSNTSGVYAGMAIFGAIGFFASVLGHELSHAAVARRKGIEVASITLFLFGGVARIRSEPKTPGDEFLIAIAGPLSSLVFGAGFFLAGLAAEWSGFTAAAVVLQLLALLNVVLALFNMLPGFPLDGGRVLRAIIWRITSSMLRATRVASVSGRVVAALMIAAGLYRVFVESEVFGGIWLILIAWFLNQAAGASYQQALITHSIERVKVADLMNTQPVCVQGGVTLAAAVDERFLADRHSSFPVLAFDGSVEGVITIDQVRDIPKESRVQMTVRQAMMALTPEMVTSPQETISSIMQRIDTNPLRRFVVVEKDRLVGILSPSDIHRYVRYELSFRQPVKPR